MSLRHQRYPRYHRPTAHADVGFIPTGVVAVAIIMKAIRIVIGGPPLPPSIRTHWAPIRPQVLGHLPRTGVVGAPLIAGAEGFVGTLINLTGVHTHEVAVVAMLLTHTRVRRGAGHR
jgi:hypothetical protein